MKERLTKRGIEQLRTQDAELVVWDLHLPGFGVRVRKSGAKTYFIQYRSGKGRSAPQRKLVIGRYDRLTLDEARDEARKQLALVAQGHDPVAEANRMKSEISISDLSDAFFVQHVEAKRKPATQTLYRHILESYVVPRFGRRHASQLRTSDLARMHAEMSDKPILANRALAVVAAMFKFGWRNGLISSDGNPARDIERYKEKSRERFLSHEELERLGRAIAVAENVGVDRKIYATGETQKHIPKSGGKTKIDAGAAAALKLLLLTGCRKQEILKLRWDQIDIRAGLARLSDSKTGAKPIYLNSVAVEVLKSIDRVGPFVFPGNDPAKPRVDLKRPWLMVTEEADLQGLRLHDLRHTFASFGAAAGLGLPIIGKLLGHADTRMTEKYAHIAAAPLRQATEIIGNELGRLLVEAPKASTPLNLQSANDNTGEVMGFHPHEKSPNSPQT
tara:strand:+ start:195 stop:1532 length:1338 start_codon:yes stop_codon:yes gene_type:complete